MNRRKLALTVMVSLITIFFSQADVNAYDKKIAHRKITEKAVDTSRVAKVLKESLGFPAGFETYVNGQRVIDWFSDGSELEDKPICRASNHFHNPLNQHPLD